MSWNTHELIVLGAGGAMPRLDLFSPEDLSLAASTYPSAKGSIYAFDYSPDGSGVVVGSRNGDVNVLQSVVPVSPQASEWSHRALPHKVAGVIQLLWISNDTVCILNESGSGWCCNPATETLSFMENGNRRLVALCHMENGNILGFAKDGMLLVWRNGEWDSPECLYENPPCWNNLHAKPVHWSAAGAIIYPSRDRRLTVLDEESMEPGSHAPDTCAADCIAIDDNVLLTVDARARNARLWNADFKSIRRIEGLPADLNQCVLLDAERPNALALDKAGNAMLLDLSTHKARVVSRLPGSDYRVCAVRPSKIRQAAQEERMRAEATRVAHEALTVMDHGDTADHCLDDLDAAGYQHVSQAIRAGAAEKEGDLAEAIRLTRRQIESLPADGPSSINSLYRYRRLLSKAGLLTLYERGELGAHTSGSQDRDMPYLEIMAMTGTMETLCRYATAANIPIMGCWHIKSLPAINCGEIHVSPIQFCEKHNSIQISQLGELPSMRPVTLHFSNTTQDLIRQAVLFQVAEGSSIHLLLSFESKTGFSTVEPIVVFSPVPVSEGVCAAEHNSRVLADYQYLMDSGATKARLAELIRASIHVLRRIITESNSMYSRKAEIK